jgi:adhesin transport system membrane fusion protein
MKAHSHGPGAHAPGFAAASLGGRGVMPGLPRAAAADAALRRPRRLMFALAALMAGLAWWAAVAPVAMVVRSEGRVVPSAKSQVVQHLEGGVLMALEVAEGQRVRAGDVLAKVSDVPAHAQVGGSEVQVEALRAKIVRLTAEARGDATLTSTAAADEAAMQEERRAFAARRRRVEQDLQVAREQVVQKRAELAEVRGRRSNLVAESEVARKQLQISDDLLARDAGSKLEMLDAQSRLLRLGTMIADADASLPRIQSAIAEAEGRGREIEARFRAEAQTELAAARTTLQRLTEEAKSGADRVARSELRAPVAGVVNRIHVNTVGGVIRPGEPVMEITPADGDMLVEARVRPADRGDLHEGMRVRVRLSAYDYAAFGSAEGVLVEISADTVPDERGERYFRVRARLNGRTRPFEGRPVMPGMTATTDILVGERTVFQYLSAPFGRFARAALSEPR